MKKAIALVLVAVMMLTVCACGKITEKDVEYVSGTVSNNVYTNTFSGLKFAPGPEWTFASEEEILEMMDIGSEYLSDEAQKTAEIGKQKTIFDMYAIDSLTGDNAIVQFENLALTIGGTSYSEEDYADVTREGLEESELEYTFGEYESLEIGGESYLTFDASASFEGVTANQKIIVRKLEKYMLCIIVTSYEGVGAGTDALADMFSAVE